MATLVGASSNQGSSQANSTTLFAPSGVTTNDLLIASVVSETRGGITGPSGWTRFTQSINPLGYQNSHEIWYKMAVPNDSGQGYQWTGSGANAGTMTAWRTPTAWVGTPPIQSGSWSNVDQAFTVTAPATGSGQLPATVIALFTSITSYAGQWSVPSGTTTAVNCNAYYATSAQFYYSIATQPSPAQTSTNSAQTADSGRTVAGYQIALQETPANQVPTAATNLSSPRTRKGIPVTVTWTHNDPNGNPQAQYEVRWRKAD